MSSMNIANNTWSKIRIVCVCTILFLCSCPSKAYGQDQIQDWSKHSTQQAKKYYLIPTFWQEDFQETMTREEMTTLAILLYKALGGSVPQEIVTTVFQDTSSKDIGAAYQLNIIKGTAPNIFSPLDVVKREEMIVIFHRMLQSLHYSVKAKQITLSNFLDYNHVSNWAKEAINDFTYMGLVQGTAENKLFAQRNATKEEAIALTLRIYEHFKYMPLYEQKNQNIVIQGISIGNSKEKVKEKLGEPLRIDQSEYGFEWYIYHNDFSNYLQVGIKNNTVVALYTNQSNWKAKNGISMGMTRTEISQKYGRPVQNIEKANHTHMFTPLDAVDRYMEEDYYVYFFYDSFKKDTLAGVMLIHRIAERELEGYQGQLTEEVRQGYQKQIFDLANTERVKAGKKPLQWDEKVARVAYQHSLDMATNHYFSHHGLDKSTLETRLKKANIVYQKAGENIGMNLNGILTHYMWMNSKAHRENILGDYTKLGVGTAFHIHEDPYAVYHTQNFYK